MPPNATLLTFTSFSSFTSAYVLHEPSLFIHRLGLCARLLHARVFLCKSVTGPMIIAPPSTAATPPTMWAHNRHSINAPYSMCRKSSSYTSAARVLGGGGDRGASLCQNLSQSLTHTQKGNETQFLIRGKKKKKKKINFQRINNISHVAFSMMCFFLFFP